MSTHHTLDVHPIPEKVLFVNETQLADPTELPPGSPSDNIRIYIPLDLNYDAILRRLNDIYRRYGELTESNEFSISSEVYNLISQIEIYDQVWFVRDVYKRQSYCFISSSKPDKYLDRSWLRNCSDKTNTYLLQGRFTLYVGGSRGNYCTCSNF